MRRVCLFLLVLGTLPAIGMAQDIAEIERLKAHLGISADATITLAAIPALPSGNPLRVYINTGLDTRVRDKFIEGVTKWNAKDGKKYGRIALVGNPKDTQILLVRYIARDNVSEESGVGSQLRFESDGKGNVVSRNVPVTYTEKTAPVYSYILATTSEGVEIVHRFLDIANLAYADRAGGLEILNTLQRMLKERGGAGK